MFKDSIPTVCYLCVSRLYQAIFCINAALGLELWQQYIFAKISNILYFHQARSCSIRPFFREYEISGKMLSENKKMNSFDLTLMLALHCTMQTDRTCTRRQIFRKIKVLESFIFMSGRKLQVYYL